MACYGKRIKTPHTGVTRRLRPSVGEQPRPGAQQKRPCLRRQRPRSRRSRVPHSPTVAPPTRALGNFGYAWGTVRVQHRHAPRRVCGRPRAHRAPPISAVPVKLKKNKTVCFLYAFVSCLPIMPRFDSEITPWPPHCLCRFSGGDSVRHVRQNDRVGSHGARWAQPRLRDCGSSNTPCRRMCAQAAAGIILRCAYSGYLSSAERILVKFLLRGRRRAVAPLLFNRVRKIQNVSLSALIPRAVRRLTRATALTAESAVLAQLKPLYFFDQLVKQVLSTGATRAVWSCANKPGG